MIAVSVLMQKGLLFSVLVFVELRLGRRQDFSTGVNFGCCGVVILSRSGVVK